MGFNDIVIENLLKILILYNKMYLLKFLSIFLKVNKSSDRVINLTFLIFYM